MISSPIGPFNDRWWGGSMILLLPSPLQWKYVMVLEMWYLFFAM